MSLKYPKPTKKKKSRHISNERITDIIPCEVCGVRNATETHELKGGGWRNTSIQYGFQLKLCSKCHKDWELEFSKEKKRTYRANKQLKVMENHNLTVTQFINILDTNYL